MDGSKIYINLITRIWIYKILIWSDFSRCLLVLAHGVISCKFFQVLKEHLVCWPLVSVMLFAVCQRASICWHTSSVFHRSPTTWCALGSMDPFPCYEPRAWFLFFLESWKKHLFSIGFEWPEEMCTLILWRQLGSERDFNRYSSWQNRTSTEAVCQTNPTQLIIALLALSRAIKVASSIPFQHSVVLTFVDLTWYAN